MRILANKSSLASVQTLDELALDFAADVHTVEERFVRAAWFNPGRMHHVACERGLTADCFTDPVNRFVFAYIGLAAEHGIHDRITLTGCAGWARREGITIDVDEWLDGILADRAACDGDLGDELTDLAAILASYVRRRDRARELLAEAARQLAGDPTEYEVIVRRKRRLRAVDAGARLAPGTQLRGRAVA